MKNFFQSTSSKLLFIGALVLILLIPQAMVRGLVDERQGRYLDTVNEVSSKWGGKQTIATPTLVVPIQKPIKSYEYDNQGNQTKTRISWKNEEIKFYSEQVGVEADLEPNVLNRGIFEVLLYKSDVSMVGNFPPLVFPEDFDKESKILWDKVYMTLGITDTKGLTEVPKIEWKGESLSLHLSENKQMLGNEYGKSLSLFQTKVDLSSAEATKALNFKANLSIKGSEEFYIFPQGQKTTATITSSWPSPSFDGNFLPATRTITDEGFKAEWDVSQFVKNTDAYFGVKLIFPVDLYQKNERAVKYGILFIVLTFVTFFLIEVLRSARLHPIQYLLVGAAMILFYVLLLALSEHTSFQTSYLIAAVSTTLLISGYCLSALKDKSAAALVAILLSTIYAYLYLLLQSSDKSLLLGALFLFVILCAIMFLTRKIDWYDLSQKKDSKKK